MTDSAQGTALPPFEAEFVRAWNTPGHTRHYLPDTDVNKVLAARYTTSVPLTLTRTMLWDMEVRKTARPELTGPDGTPLHAGTGQPLFHVEHSVGGSDSQPLNQWRIVHLTETTDDRLTAPFERMAASPWLAEHTEIYIRHDLGILLTRKPA